MVWWEWWVGKVWKWKYKENIKYKVFIKSIKCGCEWLCESVNNVSVYQDLECL